MKKNIVDDLRYLGDHEVYEPYMHHEAANEIERLQELLQNWMGCCFVDEKRGDVTFGMGVKKVWAETRAALKGDE